jgi:hypothetical protein
MNDNAGPIMDPLFARQEPIQVTPPGRMCPDPVVRLDPQGTSTVPAALPVAIEESDDESDDSDNADGKGLTAQQKEK